MEIKRALIERRSNYDLTSATTLSEQELGALLALALERSPTGFNSQSGRIVLALGAKHGQFWDLVLEGIRQEIGDTPAFEKSKAKIANLRNSAGTILFYEDSTISADLKQRFPLYQKNVDTWVEQAQGMLQMTVWTLLTDAGMGASLQHYNELVSQTLRESWNLDANWRLIAQMPFGIAKSTPPDKDRIPGYDRMLVIK